MTSPTSLRRSGSGPTDGAPNGVESTVFTRLRAKQSRPGRAVLRRQARRARRTVPHSNPFLAWLRKQEPVVGTRINPARDHRSRKSGRLRKELR